MGRRALRALPTAVAMFFVVAAYLFAGSNGRFRFERVSWEQSHYASLAEGFLRGQVSMAHKPDPALIAVPDPYLPELRKDVPSLHDASYFEGRYYLYFTPIPALLVHIPMKLVTGRYPSDPMVGTLFAIAAFLAQAAFVIRALRGRKSVLPQWLWIAFAGLGNLTLFLLADVWMYEVAALCGMFFASLWAWSLLRFLDAPSWRSGALTGTFLALAIASRPTLIVLGVVTSIAIVTTRNWRIALAAAVPIVVVGSMYMVYNEARFRSPFETGLQYQLTNVAMRDFPSCRLCTGAELGRFLNTVQQYVFRPVEVNARFPFVALRYNEYDPGVTFPAKHEEVGGIFAVIPLLMASAFTVLLVRDRAARLLTAGGWLTLFALSTCAWVTARYELDFIPALVLGAIVALEAGLAAVAVPLSSSVPRSSSESSQRTEELRGTPRTRALRVLAALGAGYSILLGTLLGLTGRTQAFSRFNPELFEKLAGWFTSR